jgi:hypothetical protein
MTPPNALRALHDHLDDGEQLTGLEPVFFRLYPENTEAGAADCILFRPDGGAAPNELMQQPGVTLAICTARPDTGYERAVAIRDYLIANHIADGVCNFQILADIVGPSMLESGRSLYELNVRVWT